MFYSDNCYKQYLKSQGEKTHLKKLYDTIRQFFVFTDDTLRKFETNVDEIVHKGKNGALKKSTIDLTPLRIKYFFGERYTYGSQNGENGIGSERLYPKNSVDPIPTWITKGIINPLIEAKILPKDFVNSVVINDYQPGGCIVSHIDPPHIFDRPIVSLSLFSDSALCFGCKFHYKPLRCSQPLLKLEMPRGVVTSLSGFAANEITHCVRPEDITGRRAVIMLRRVHDCAPRLPQTAVMSITRNISYTDSLELTTEDFIKFHQTLLKWQNQGSVVGKIRKRFAKKKDGTTRYSANCYKIV
ncbi:RNA demethylase ALKBH5-like [Diorhabda carinulata]|uniref:RNA demethylase ALKBH5-like n=1 Tax=Diorhabda carinulata TaxID=1163345 RepID=UPI0025A0EF8D|nr:RNA demethylase ALKBH5-like [Diorhabda carinulata]